MHFVPEVENNAHMHSITIHTICNISLLKIPNRQCKQENMVKPPEDILGNIKQIRLINQENSFEG